MNYKTGYRTRSYQNNRHANMRPLGESLMTSELHWAVEEFRSTGIMPEVRCACKKLMVFKEGDAASGYHWRALFCKKRKCNPIWY